jgi:FG-GAP-like repeat
MTPRTDRARSRSARGGWPTPRRPRLGAGLLALALLAALAGCGNNEGEDGTFKPVPTDNTDFDSPAYVPLGNLPVSMDLWPRGAPLDLVAVVNSVEDPPLNPDGTVKQAGSVMVLQNVAGTFTLLTTLPTLAFPSLALFAHLHTAPASEPDLVVLDDLNLHIAVYLSTGPGTYSSTPQQEFTLAFAPAQITVTDLDGDGLEDIVMTEPGDNKIVALHADGGGSGTLTESITTTPNLLGRFYAGDLNGDANLDLAALSGLTSTVDLWQWDASVAPAGAFVQNLAITSLVPGLHPIDIVGGHLINPAPAPIELAVLTDILIDSLNYVYFYVNDGTGNMTPNTVPSVAMSARVSRLLPLGPVAGPLTDLAVLHNSLRLFTFLKSGNATYTVVEPGTTRSATDLASGLVDGNAIPDIVTAESERRTIGIFAGDGLGNFARTQIGLLTLPTFPRLVSVFGGGFDDLLVLEPNSDRLAVFRNLH